MTVLIFKRISISLIIISCLFCLSCTKKDNTAFDNNTINFTIKNETDYIFRVPSITKILDDKNLFLLNMKIDYVRKIEKLDEKYNQTTITEAKYFHISSSEIKPNEEMCFNIKINDKFNENFKIAFFIFQDEINREMKYSEYCNVMIQHGFIVLMNYKDFANGKISINCNNIFKVTELAYEDFDAYKEILLKNPEKLIPVDSDFIKN